MDTFLKTLLSNKKLRITTSGDTAFDRCVKWAESLGYKLDIIEQGYNGEDFVFEAELYDKNGKFVGYVVRDKEAGRMVATCVAFGHTDIVGEYLDNNLGVNKAIEEMIDFYENDGTEKKEYTINMPDEEGGRLVGTYNEKELIEFAQNDWEALSKANDMEEWGFPEPPEDIDTAIEFLQGLYYVSENTKKSKNKEEDITALDSIADLDKRLRYFSCLGERSKDEQGYFWSSEVYPVDLVNTGIDACLDDIRFIRKYKPDVAQQKFDELVDILNNLFSKYDENNSHYDMSLYIDDSPDEEQFMCFCNGYIYDALTEKEKDKFCEQFNQLVYSANLTNEIREAIYSYAQELSKLRKNV